jgi:hypothetical protein
VVKAHFLTSVSSKLLKISQMVKTVGHGNEIGIRIMKSGQKAKDGRKGPSLAFCPFCCVVWSHG